MKRPQPRTVFCGSVKEAMDLAQRDGDSRALSTGPGTMRFHSLIAEHGAQAFRTLYAPVELAYLFKTPAGGIVEYTDAARVHHDLKKKAVVL